MVESTNCSSYLDLLIKFASLLLSQVSIQQAFIIMRLEFIHYFKKSNWEFVTSNSSLLSLDWWQACHWLV